MSNKNKPSQYKPDTTRVMKLMEKYQPLLYLHEWEFKMHFPSEDLELSVTAETEIIFQYKTCKMTIYPRYFRESSETQEKVIIHELCHCITNPMDELILRASLGKPFAITLFKR